MSAKLPDMTGQKIGRWTVVKLLPRKPGDQNDRNRYLCRCECGTEKDVRAADLAHGTSTMCRSCAQRERGNRIAGRTPAEVQAYLLTHTVTETAEHYGLTHGAMTRYMSRHNLRAMVKGRHRPKPPRKPTESQRRAFQVALIPRHIPGVNERSPHAERRWKYGGADYLARMRSYERMVAK